MTKEEKKEYNKKYNILNKKKISKQKKEYYSNLEVKNKKLEYSKNRYVEKKEEIINTVMKYHWNNQEKIKVYKKKYREDNPNKIKERSLKRNFGINLESYTLMLEKQNGLCAICNNPEKAKSKKSGKIMMLAVDHCHKTGIIRGLLCSTCNPALGAFNDSIETLELVISYLKRHGKETI